MRTLKSLLNLTQKYSRTYFFSILATLGAVVFWRLIPLVLKFTIDNVLRGETPTWPPLRKLFIAVGGREFFLRNLWAPGLAVLLFTLFNGLFSFFRDKCAALVGENVAKDLRLRLHSTLLRAKLEFFATHRSGDVIQRCTSDVDTVRQFLSQDSVSIWRNVFMLVFVYYVMLSLDLRMTLVSSVLVPALIVSAFIFYRKVEPEFQLIEESEGQLTVTLQESLTGIRVVKAFGREPYEVEKFRAKNADYRLKDLALLERMAKFWSFSDFLALLQVALVVLLGTVWVVNGALSLGTLVVFSTYVWMLIWPVRELGIVLSRFGRVKVALERIEEVLSAPLEPYDTNSASPDGAVPSGLSFMRMKGEIEFRNVWFGYHSGRPILRGVSLKVEPGQIVAFFGPSGSGKTTAILLLLRLFEPHAGEVLLDGVDVRDIPLEVLRRNIGLVPQESFLFSKTIAENIAIAVDSPSPPDDGRVREAARLAAIDRDIENFKSGYGTLVGERGVTLSGGQRQRVCVARILVGDYPVLVFDDALSAVDSETEHKIWRAIESERGRRTILIVSHRVSTIRSADKIFVFENGVITNSGTHEELVNQDGLYAKVWRIERLIASEQ